MRRKFFSGENVCGRRYCYNIVLYELCCLVGYFENIEFAFGTNLYSLFPLKGLDAEKGLFVLRFFYLLYKNFPFFFIGSHLSKIGVQHKARRRVSNVYNYYFHVNCITRPFSYDLFFFIDFFRFLLYTYGDRRAQYVSFVRKMERNSNCYIERFSFHFYDSYVKDFELRRFLDFYISLFSRMINDVMVPFKSLFHLGCLDASLTLDGSFFLCEIFFSFFGFFFCEKQVFFLKRKDYSFYQRLFF